MIQSSIVSQTQITHQQVIDLVKTLPNERLRSLYDFALFLKVQPAIPVAEPDIFGESEEEIRADEERWDEQFAATKNQLRTLAYEAAAEFRTGQTAPMAFTNEGRLVR